MLLSTSKAMEPIVVKSIARAKASLCPHMHFYCITSGIPAKEMDSERCGIQLFELDDLGKYKEPKYVPPEKVTGRMRKKSTKSKHIDFKEGRFKPVNVHYRTLATNRKLAVSLVELQTSVTKWSFVQCFLAYKTSFVLGDTFFSRRVKHILGQPIMIHPQKVKSIAEIHNAMSIDQQFEPLSAGVQKVLGVRKNSQLPLMVHCAGYTLPGFYKYISKSRKTKSKNSEENKQLQLTDTTLDPDDLVICDQSTLPEHFVHTLDRLDLNIFAQQNNETETVEINESNS